jgi:hypothetical protein
MSYPSTSVGCRADEDKRLGAPLPSTVCPCSHLTVKEMGVEDPNSFDSDFIPVLLLLP